MVIVEGPDGAGKSTLVAKLCEAFDLKQGERGTKDRSKLYTVTVPDTFRALVEAVEGREQPHIWDRLFYSEMVYHDLVGRDCEFSPEQQAHIKALIEAMHVPVIVCLPPLSVVVENIEDTSQMKGVHEHIEEIHARYRSMLDDSFFPEHTLVYDYTDRDDNETPYEDIVVDVADYLHSRRSRSW